MAYLEMILGINHLFKLTFFFPLNAYLKINLLSHKHTFEQVALHPHMLTEVCHELVNS